MSMRIVKINIKDYRAFRGDGHTIDLPNGENLLAYGENGSGKSSLFRGMDDFLTSSAGAVNLLDKANMFREEGQQPRINVDFQDLATQERRTYFINEVQGNDFMEKANLSKAFFGYSDIQAVHAGERQKTGHFHTLLAILKDYEYRATNTPIRNLWQELEDMSSKRWSQKHQVRMEDLLRGFESAMSNLQDELTQKMREIMGYFNQQIDITFDYRAAGYERYRKLQPPYVNIRVSYFNRTLPDAYPEILNEARLSSLALSLYLASLLTRPPHASGYKILFLDDALIGLDSGNRIPLLRILHELFGDYQIFLTTYDRHWYEMAKDWFEKEALKQTSSEKTKWKYYEMYSILEPNKQYSFPVILPADSFLGKANRHMNNPVYPDYAAAANNFRKAAEAILLKELPEHELKNSKGETPLLMLKALLEKCEHFLGKIEQPKMHVIELNGYLRILLNPLSHYNPETPIHKGELLQIEPILVALQSQLQTIRDNKTYQLIGMPGEQKARFRFNSTTGGTGFYPFELRDCWYRYINTATGNVDLSNVGVTSTELRSVALDGTEKIQPLNKKYASLSIAFTSITKHLIEKGHIAPLAENPHFKDVLEVQQGGIWKPYQEIITTP